MLISAREAKAGLAEILEARPDLKGKSIEAVRRVCAARRVIAQTSTGHGRAMTTLTMRLVR